MNSVCRRIRARCNLHATLVALTLTLALTACDKKEDVEKRPVGSGATDIFGSAAPTSPDAGSPADAGSPLDAGATEGPCATDGGPGCPMLRFMKGEVAIAFAAKKTPDVLAALDKLAANAPSGYTNWASISKDGAAAAKAGDWNAVKASCRGCHSQYKDKYIGEHRSDPVHGK